MVQYNLKNEPITELDRLYLLRSEYYKELLNDIETYKSSVKRKVIDYRNKVKDIDILIKKEQLKLKSKINNIPKGKKY